MQPVISRVLSKVSLLRQGALDGEVLYFTPDSLKPPETLYISSSQQKQQQHGSETQGSPVAELLPSKLFQILKKITVKSLQIPGKRA